MIKLGTAIFSHFESYQIDNFDEILTALIGFIIL